MTKTVVITGASGFIGHHICLALLNAGFNILPVTRKRQPTKINGTPLTVVSDYRECPKGDYLIHLAEDPNRTTANAGGENYRKNATQTLDYLISQYTSQCLYISSCAVYGAYSGIPFSEENTVSSTDLYSEIKIQNEKTVLQNGGTVVRLGNIYGKGMPKSNILSNIIDQLSNNGPLQLRSTKPTRDFLFIDDLTGAITNLLNANIKGIFNIASGESTSIDQLAKCILKQARQTDRTIVSTSKTTDTSNVAINIQKIQHSTQWQPKYSLAQGIAKLFTDLNITVENTPCEKT